MPGGTGPTGETGFLDYLPNLWRLKIFMQRVTEIFNLVQRVCNVSLTGKISIGTHAFLLSVQFRRLSGLGIQGSVVVVSQMSQIYYFQLTFDVTGTETGYFSFFRCLCN